MSSLVACYAVALKARQESGGGPRVAYRAAKSALDQIFTLRRNPRADSTGNAKVNSLSDRFC
jgi:hypothetical protein